MLFSLRFFFLFLFIFIGNLQLCEANEASASTIESVRIPVPAGYKEVLPDDYKEYIASLAAELAYSGDAFLRLYVKKEEHNLVGQLDIDDLSSTIIAVWFQKYSDKDSLKKHNIIDSTILKKPENSPHALLVATNNNPLELFLKKTNRKHITELQSFLTKYRGASVDYNWEAFDKNAIKKWLISATKTPQPDMDLGVVLSANDCLVYAWLQSANNDFNTFGKPSQSPMLVSYALCSVGEEKLGLIFSNDIVTVDDIDSLFIKQFRYLEKHCSSFSRVRAPILPKVTASYNVLSFLALETFFKGYSAKAPLVNKRLLNQLNEIDPASNSQLISSLKINALTTLAYCYAENNSDKKLVDDILHELQRIKKIQGLEKEVILLQQLITNAYRELGEIQSAVSMLEKTIPIANNAFPKESEEYIEFATDTGMFYLALGAPQKAIDWLMQAKQFGSMVYGHQSPTVFSLTTEIARAYVIKQNYTEAQEILKNSMSSIVELRKDDVARYPMNLYVLNLRIQDKKAQYTFWGKLVGAYLIYLKQLPGNNIEPSDEFFIKRLKPLLSQANVIATEKDFQGLLNSPNTPDDTPYDKGRTWMRGPEIDLYAKYGEVASALEQAGKSGTESEKKIARENFQSWFDEVEKVLGDK